MESSFFVDLKAIATAPLAVESMVEVAPLAEEHYYVFTVFLPYLICLVTAAFPVLTCNYFFYTVKRKTETVRSVIEQHYIE